MIRIILDAQMLFIKEEQRHSEYLGRFLDSQSTPRLSKLWIDKIFRKIRSGTLIIVWLHHRVVLKRGGFSFFKFSAKANYVLSRLLLISRGKL
jgi:hypothetical protein